MKRCTPTEDGGVYQPQQQDDGTPYPEDEDDDYNPDT